MEKITNTILGAGSISLIGQVPAIETAANLDVPGIVQTIIQLIVAVGTLVAMFKKKRVLTN